MLDSATNDEAASKPRSKSAARAKKRVSWPDVLRAVQDEKRRFIVSYALRSSGFDADSFGHKREARVTAAEALVRLEDALEDQASNRRKHNPARDEASRIREVRRRLELELWPRP